ncbi:MAG TPA: hypothetical protein VI589_10845 [Vicinamibacteria bacterium]
MPSHRRLAVFSTLLATFAALALQAGTVRAADPAESEITCGPGGVNGGDTISLNVGNPGRAPQDPAVLLLRLLDADGQPLAEETITLGPGQSQAMRFTTRRVPRRILVRGEVVILTGPTNLRLAGTMQVFRPGLTYGPHFICHRGDTGGRGPV